MSDSNSNAEMNYTIRVLSMVWVLPCCSQLLGPTTEYKKKEKICSFFALLSPRHSRKDGRSWARRFFVPSVQTKLELSGAIFLLFVGSSVEIKAYSSLMVRFHSTLELLLYGTWCASSFIALRFAYRALSL